MLGPAHSPGLLHPAVGLLSMPVEILHLILTNIGPGNLEALKALVKKLTLLRKECLFLITQLEGLLSGMENVCRLIDGADTVRRATITANLVALRDRVRALRDQIAAQATALGLRLQAAKKAESQKRSLMRL